MFKCEVHIELPLVLESDIDLVRYYKVAEYSSDPGWKIGDTVPFKDVELIQTIVNDEIVKNKSPRFNFDGVVIKREEIAEPDQLILWICLETDKENFDDMIRTIQQSYPELNLKDTRK